MLKNKNMTATYENREIKLADLCDSINEPRAYTTKVRGIDKGWEALQKTFNENMKFWDAIHLLDSFGLDIHEYCSVD